jgi:hypothetical protein
MSHQQELEQWNQEVSIYMGHLNTAFIKVLSLYAFGMVLTRHCGQTLVVEIISQLMGVKPNTIRQRLRELTYESQAKRGEKRDTLDVTSCFTPLMKWVLTKLDPRQKTVVIALDVTYLRDRFTILAVSVVMAGCAIPVAWHIQRGHEPGNWNPIWKRLLVAIQRAVPQDWQVSVLTDGGLYSKPLFNQIRKLRWHPHMRIGTQGLCREPNGAWFPLATLAQRGMTPTRYRLICFKGHPLVCTLLAQWDPDYDKPCLVVTDLSLQQAHHAIYPLRFWIERGFKALKRGGLHWEHTKMTCPQRAERLWLVISIALLYLIPLGVSAENAIPRSTDTASRQRSLSCLARGWITVMVHLISHQPICTHSSTPFAYDPIPIPVPAHTYP